MAAVNEEQVRPKWSLFPGKPGLDGHLLLAALTVVPWIWFGRTLGGSALVFIPGIALLITFRAGSWSSAFKLRMVALLLLLLTTVLTAASLGWFLIPAVGFMLMGVLHAEGQRGEEKSVGAPTAQEDFGAVLDAKSIRWELDEDGEGPVWVTYKTARGPLEKQFETFASFQAAHPDEAQFVLAYDVDEDESYPD